MLSVIVPYYSNVKGLVATLINLQTQKHFDHGLKLVVIDTSPDAKAKEIVSEFYRGFAVVIDQPGSIYKAWNAGIKEAEEDCLIINDDILMPNNFLANLETAKYMHPNVFAFVPRTNGRKYGAKKIADNFSFKSERLVDRGQLKEVEWLVGFCYYLTRDCIKTIGLFDEKYDVWFGDDDYQRRLLAKNRIIEISPSLIHHYGGQSYSYQSPEVLARIDKDRQYYMKKFNLTSL